MKNSKTVNLVGCVVASLLLTATLHGQSQVDMPKRGWHPNASHNRTEVDSIDPSSGAVNITVPVAQLPPGRSGTTVGLSLRYSSQIYDTVPTATGDVLLNTSPYGGWRYSHTYELVLDSRSAPITGCTNDPSASDKIYRLRVLLSDGSAHTLHPKLQNGGSNYFTDACGNGFYQVHPDGACQNCNGSLSLPDNLSYYTTDGSYLRLEMTPVRDPSTNDLIPWTARQWSLFFPDGSRVFGIGRESVSVRDRNSNVVSIVKFLSK